MKYAIVPLLVLAGLVACSQNSSSSTSESTSASTETSSAAPSAASPQGTAMVAAAPAGDGQKIFVTNCASCHQSDGKGAPGAFPPLAGNATVTGDPKAVIHDVKFGLTGKVQVGADSYNGVMPPWGSQLSDAQIASVVTYIRSSWGNTGSAVTAADVAAVKK